VALADTELVLRAWLDRLAIQDLIYRHSDALTRADWKQAEALYAPEAIWESPKQGLRYDTRAAFLEMLAGNSTFGFCAPNKQHGIHWLPKEGMWDNVKKTP
jgi:hypothetical protein